jgi:competence protein ComEA
MLAVTLGSLIWIGSVTPVTKVMPGQPQLMAKSPVTTLPSPQPLSVSTTARSAAATSSQPLTAKDRPMPRPVEEPGPSVVQEKSHVDSRPVRQTAAPQVDLNQATVSDLEALPGIGPKLAQRVIDHRDARGPFTKVEDLRDVKGIGRKKFDRLRPHVLVTNTKSLARHKGAL